MADLPKDRIRALVGYASVDSVLISLITFNDKPITATCSGGTCVIGTLSALGTDHPDVSHVGHSGLLTVSGLSADTIYDWSVTHEGETIDGSFRTLPLPGSDFTVLFTSCEKFNGFFASSAKASWANVKAVIEDSDPPVYAYSHTDDFSYADGWTPAVNGAGGKTIEVETGINYDVDTGSAQNVTPIREYKYAIAWMAHLGMFTQWNFDNHSNPNRQWIFRNCAHWLQVGDHEFYGDANSHTSDGTDTAKGWLPVREAAARNVYDAIFGISMPPRLRANELYWGFTAGDVRFGAFDRVSHCLPYDACDAGDTHSYGDSGSSWNGTCSGATIPTRTEVGITTDTQPEDFLGAVQVDDLVDHFTKTEATEPFKWMFCSTAITGHNQPYADWWPNEFTRFLYGNGTTHSGIMGSAKCNGEDGHYSHFVGDVHNPWIKDHTANGVDGLGKAALNLNGASKVVKLWEFSAGTVNGSPTGTVGNINIQGGRYRYVLQDPGIRDHRNACVFLLKTFGSESDKRQVVELHQVKYAAPSLQIAPYQLLASSQSNDFNQLTTSTKIG